MSKRSMILEIGGKERGLSFNVNTLEFLQTELAIDPLAYKAESTAWKDLLPYVVNIIYVAMLSYCKSKKQDVDFTLDQVKEWTGELSGAEISKIATMWNTQFNEIPQDPSANGEVGKSAPVTFQ
jgi:hypothetical protein